MEAIDAHVPADLDVHLVLDNYGTHKTPRIRRWLTKAPAVPRALHAHLRVVDEPGRTLVRRAHDQAIASRYASQCRGADGARSGEFIAVTNDAPKPFVWTKSADEILASIARFAQRTLAAPSGLRMFRESLLQDTRSDVLKRRLVLPAGVLDIARKWK